MIDVITLVPIFFVGGLTGALFQPLALSYGLAVLASMLVAMTVTPALGLILLRKAPIERRESPVVRWLQSGYQRGLSRALRAPLLVAFAGGVIVLGGVAVLPRLGQSLLPEFKERDFLIHWISKPGTSLPEERRIVTAVGNDLLSIPGIRSFGSHIGQAINAEEIVGVNFGENWISLDPSADYDKTLEAIHEVIDRYPGLYHDLLTYFNERVDEVLAGSTEPIVVRIFGQDLDQLRSTAQEVRERLSQIPGIAEEHVGFQEDVPQLEVRVDLAAAQHFGIKPGDVRRAAATLMAGEEVGGIYRDGKVYDVQVWSPPTTRDSLTDVRNLLIDTPSGHVRLRDVADISIRPNPNTIERETDSRRIDVEAAVEGRDLGSVVGDVQRSLRNVQFPLGYHAELLGEYAERQEAEHRLFLMAIAALIAVFLLLRIAVHSWRLAWLAFLDLPIALAGGVLAIYFWGGALISLGSLVGFFTVLGISTRNGIMMINHFQHLEHQEGVPFGSGLVLQGARERLSPIMMTALATGLAVIPLAIAGNLPGHEIEHPMAIVIIGGLITSTFRNLFIVPTYYLRIGRNRPRAGEPQDG